MTYFCGKVEGDGSRWAFRVPTQKRRRGRMSNSAQCVFDLTKVARRVFAREKF